MCLDLLRRQITGGSWSEANPGQIVRETLSLKNTSQKKKKKGLIQWLKVKALRV
jgi:hypothetical protein